MAKEDQQRRHVEEWTAKALRETAMATTTMLREGCQRWYLGLQKTKGLGERKMERTYAGFFLGFFNFHFFLHNLILFNLTWQLKTLVPPHVAS